MTMDLNRRMLLGSSLALGTASLALPRIALAQGVGEKNLLFVMLRGAADGMAMAAPLGDPSYEALRGATLSEYEGARRANGFFAIHPAFEQVGMAFEAGEALLVHAAATSYRERSHFDGQNMLETGATQPYAKSDGWLNRLAGMMLERDGEDAGRALAISATMPLALRGAAPASSYAPNNLPEASNEFKARVGLLYGEDQQLGELWSQALETQAMANMGGGDDGIRSLRDAHATGELTASLMRGRDGARIAMVELGGWDTHANQLSRFRRNARALDTLLGAYRDGLGAEWANTMVVVVTEFGRTVRFNGTNGTDHGTGSAAMVMGGAVKGGRVIADWPGLRENDLFEARDLKPTIALESVLSGAIAEHMALDPELTMTQLFPGRSGQALSGIVRS